MNLTSYDYHTLVIFSLFKEVLLFLLIIFVRCYSYSFFNASVSIKSEFICNFLSKFLLIYQNHVYEYSQYHLHYFLLPGKILR
jgi:hypothetical protein